MAEWINIALVSDLEPGQTQQVQLEDETAVAVFNLDGDYFALEDVCTHDGSPLLGSGVPVDQLIEGDQVICPRHGARFCIRTGKALTPPAYASTPRFPVRVNDNIVQIYNEPIMDES